MVIVLTAVCFVFGGALASQRVSHIQVASFADRARPQTRRALGLLCRALAVLYLALLLYAAIKQAIPSLAVMETSGRAWDVPMPAFLKTVLVVGVALMLVQELSHLRHRTPPRTPRRKPPRRSYEHRGPEPADARDHARPARHRAAVRVHDRTGRVRLRAGAVRRAGDDGRRQPHLQLHDRVRARLGPDVHPHGRAARAFRRHERAVPGGTRVGRRRARAAWASRRW